MSGRCPFHAPNGVGHPCEGDQAACGAKETGAPAVSVDMSGVASSACRGAQEEEGDLRLVGEPRSRLLGFRTTHTLPPKKTRTSRMRPSRTVTRSSGSVVRSVFQDAG